MTLSTPGENYPQLHASAYVAESAQIIGDVRLAAKSSVWFQSVLRGDSDQIVIGEETNVQDATICHVDPGFPLGMVPESQSGIAAFCMAARLEMTA